jgi:hypothetical protein
MSIPWSQRIANTGAHAVDRHLAGKMSILERPVRYDGVPALNTGAVEGQNALSTDDL